MYSGIRTTIRVNILSRKEDFWLCLVYACISIPAYLYFRYHYDVPDMYQYITIAKKYSGGNFQEALNSYWGPLLSWLLVPFILLKIDPFFGLKILQIFIGFYTLLICFRFIDSTIPALRIIVKLVLIPLILSYALLSPSPDLLFLALLLQIILLTASSEISVFPLACVGLLLYLTKGVGLYLFPAILVLMVFVKIWGGKANPILYKKAVVSFLIFTAFSFTWICLLSIRYGELTPSSAGRYNLNLIGSAKGNNLEWKHPIDNGLYAPFTQTATSAWEEPYRLPQESWSMFRSVEDFKHYIQILGRNMSSLFYVSFGRRAGTVAILSFLVFALLQYARQQYEADPKDVKPRWELLLKSFPPLSEKHLLLLLTAIFVSVGHSLILVMPRYVWINTVAAVILFAVLAEIIIKRSKPAGIVLTILMILSILGDFTLTTIRFDQLKVEESFRAALKNLPSGPFAGIQDHEKKMYATGCLMSLYSGQAFYGVVSLESFQKTDSLKKLQESRIKEIMFINERNSPDDYSSLPPLDLIKIR